jgi:hypothetical protein
MSFRDLRTDTTPAIPDSHHTSATPPGIYSPEDKEKSDIEPRPNLTLGDSLNGLTQHKLDIHYLRRKLFNFPILHIASIINIYDNKELTQENLNALKLLSNDARDGKFSICLLDQTKHLQIIISDTGFAYSVSTDEKSLKKISSYNLESKNQDKSRQKYGPLEIDFPEELPTLVRDFLTEFFTKYPNLYDGLYSIAILFICSFIVIEKGYGPQIKSYIVKFINEYKDDLGTLKDKLGMLKENLLSRLKTIFSTLVDGSNVNITNNIDLTAGADSQLVKHPMGVYTSQEPLEVGNIINNIFKSNFLNNPAISPIVLKLPKYLHGGYLIIFTKN